MRHSLVLALICLWAAAPACSSDGGGSSSAAFSSGVATAVVPPPADAVISGSFAVWATPSRPKPFEDYIINVQVSLPVSTTNYVVDDLSGMILGTDGYRKHIGKAGKTQSFDFNAKGSALLKSRVIGGKRGVQDTIMVRSELLNEDQTMHLTFAN